MGNDNQSFVSRGEILSIAGLLIFALLLRLIFFTGVLGYDELLYSRLAFNGFPEGLSGISNLQDIQLRAGLVGPVALAYLIFGPSEFSSVLFPLFASLLGTLALYAIGRLTHSHLAGLLGGFLWASFSPHVFESTRLMPDSPMAGLGITAVFFFLLSQRLRGRSAIAAFAVSMVFLLWAFMAKQLAIITALFIVIAFIGQRSKFILERLRHRWQQQRLLVRWSTIVLVLVSLGLFSWWYFIANVSQPMFVLHNTAADTANLLVSGTTEESLPADTRAFQTDIFLPLLPLTIMAIYIALKDRDPTKIVLGWAAVQFLYFEWGSISLDLTKYAPIVARTSDRNALFLFAPILLLCGIALAKMPWPRYSNTIFMGLATATLGFAWLLRHSWMDAVTQPLLALSLFVAILGSLSLVRLGRAGPVLVTGAVFFSLLTPAPPMHIDFPYWQSQRAYRDNLGEVSDFLHRQPGFPILAFSRDNAEEFALASNYTYPYAGDIYGKDLHSGAIYSDPEAWKYAGSAYVLVRDEYNQQPPPTAWKFAEFGSGLQRPISIYRILSPSDAADALESARVRIQEDPSTASWNRLLGAAINLGEAGEALHAWTTLQTSAPGSISIEVITPLLLDTADTHPDWLGPNLLADGFPDWEVIEGVNVASTDEQSIRLVVPESNSGQALLNRILTLESGRAYLFEAFIRSEMPVIALSASVGWDSLEYPSFYATGGSVRGILILPQHPDTQLDIALSLALTEFPGTIFLTQISLREIWVEP